MAMSQDTFNTFLEIAGEPLQRLDSASNGAVAPLLPESQSSPLIVVIPKVLQIILQHINSSQPLVGRQQLVELDAVGLLLDVLAISQQKPAGTFNDLASGLVFPEPIGLVDTNTVDYLPAVLGD